MGAGKQVQPTEYICLLSPLTKGLEPFLLTNKLGEKEEKTLLAKTSTNDRALPKGAGRSRFCTLHLCTEQLRVWRLASVFSLTVGSWKMNVRAAVDELKCGPKTLKESSKRSDKYDVLCFLKYKCLNVDY